MVRKSVYLSLVLVLVLISVVSADNYECEQIIKTPGKGHIDFELGACKSEDCDAFNDILNEFSCDYDYYEFSAYTMSHEYINSKILDMVDEDEDYIGNWNVALDEQPVVVEMVDDAKCDIDDIKETLDFISDYENKGFTKDQVICDPICGIQDVAWLDEENKLFFLMNLDNIDEDISWVFAEPFSWADWPIGDSPEVLSYSVLGFTETSHATDQGNSGKDSPSIGFSYNIKDEITSETNSGSLEHLYVLAGDCNNYFKNDDGEYYFSEGLLEDWQTCEVRRKGTTDATVTGAIYAETAGCDAGASVTVDQLFYCSENGEKISLKSVNTLPCNNVDNAYINDWFKIGDVPDDQISFDDVYFVAKYDWTKQTLPDSDELDKEDVFVRVAMLKENSNVVHGLSCGPSSISDVSQVPITKYKDLFNAAGELSGQTDYRIGFGTFYDEDDGQNMNAQGTSYFNSPFYTGYGNFRGQITKDDSESCCFAGKSISGISVQLISDLLLNDEMKLAEDKVLCYSGELYLWPPCEYINFDSDFTGDIEFGDDFDPITWEITAQQTACDVWTWAEPNVQVGEHVGSSTFYRFAKDIDIDKTHYDSDKGDYYYMSGYFKCRDWQDDCWTDDLGEHGAYWITDLDNDGLGGTACMANKRKGVEGVPFNEENRYGEIERVSDQEAGGGFDWLFDGMSPSNPYVDQGDEGKNPCCGDDDSDFGDVRIARDGNNIDVYKQCLFMPDGAGGHWEWLSMPEACESDVRNGDWIDNLDYTKSREKLMGYGGEDFCCGDDLGENLILNGDFDDFDIDEFSFFGWKPENTTENMLDYCVTGFSCTDFSTFAVSKEQLAQANDIMIEVLFCDTLVCKEWLMMNSPEDLFNSFKNEFPEFGPSNTLQRNKIGSKVGNDIEINYDSNTPFDTLVYYSGDTVNVDLDEGIVESNEVFEDLISEPLGFNFNEEDVEEFDEEPFVWGLPPIWFDPGAWFCNAKAGAKEMPMDYYFMPNYWIYDPVAKQDFETQSPCQEQSGARMFKDYESDNGFLILSNSGDEFMYGLSEDGDNKVDKYYHLEKQAGFDEVAMYSYPFDCFTNTNYIFSLDVAFSRTDGDLNAELLFVEDTLPTNNTNFEDIILASEGSYEIFSSNELKSIETEDGEDVSIINVFAKYKKIIDVVADDFEKRKCVLRLHSEGLGHVYVDNVEFRAPSDLGWIADGDGIENKYHCAPDNIGQGDYLLDSLPEWHSASTSSIKLKTQTIDNVKMWDTISNDEEWFYCNADGLVDDLNLGKVNSDYVDDEDGISLNAYETFRQSESLAGLNICPDIDNCGNGKEWEAGHLYGEDGCDCDQINPDVHEDIPWICVYEFWSDENNWIGDKDQGAFCTDYNGNGCCDDSSCENLDVCGGELDLEELDSFNEKEKKDCSNDDFLTCVGKPNASVASLQFDCSELDGLYCQADQLCLGGYMTHSSDTNFCCVGGDCKLKGDANVACADQGGELCYTNTNDVIYEECQGLPIDSSDGVGDYTCCYGEYPGEEWCKIQDDSQANHVSNASFICYHEPITPFKQNPIAECCAGFGCYNLKNPERLDEHNIPGIGKDLRVLGPGSMLYAIETFDKVQGDLLLDKLRKEVGDLEINVKSNQKVDWSEFEFLAFDVASTHPLANIVLTDQLGNVWSDRIDHYMTNYDIPGKWHHVVIKLTDLFYDDDPFTSLENKGITISEMEQELVDRVWPDKFYNDYVSDNYDLLYETYIGFPLLKLNLNKMQSIKITVDYPGTVIAVDNVHLMDKDEEYENKYCTGNYKTWIDDLDPAEDNPQVDKNDPKEVLPYKFACQSQLSYGWTGSQCCGDDTTWSLANLEGFREYYVDENAGCFAGYRVDDGEVVGEVIGVPEAYNNIMYDDEKFYYCSYLYDPEDVEYETQFLGELMYENALNKLKAGTNPSVHNLLEKDYCNIVETEDFARFCSYGLKWSNDISGGALPGQRDTTKNAINLIVNSDFEK